MPAGTCGASLKQAQGGWALWCRSQADGTGWDLWYKRRLKHSLKSISQVSSEMQQRTHARRRRRHLLHLPAMLPVSRAVARAALLAVP